MTLEAQRTTVTPPPPKPETEALLERLTWLRSLARSLVRDPHLAEDLTQATCAAALEKRPRADEPLDGWLATVMRNFSRQWRRTGARRDAREQAVARGERQGSTLDLVEKVSTQKELVDAVLGLPEPYREAVLMRYFEELPPRAIAARLDVPLATVKSRIARGLAQLRGTLATRFERKGTTWLAALTPLTLPPPSVLPTLSLPGALAVSTPLKIGIALTVGTALLVVTQLPPDAPLNEPVEAQQRAAVQAPAPAATELDFAAAIPRAGERSAVELDAPAATQTAPATSAVVATLPPDASTLKGRVLMTDGSPLPGVEIGAGPSVSELARVVAVTDGGGRFTWEDRERGVWVGIDSPDWTTVLAAMSSETTNAERVLVAARTTRWSGWVVDREGRPVAEAELRLELPGDFRARFDEVLDFSTELRWNAETDVDGSFTLVGPAVEGASLTAVGADRDTTSTAAPVHDETGIVLVLGAEGHAGDWLRGRVEDDRGNPVAGAHVGASFDSVTTDAAGEFELRYSGEGSSNRRMGEFLEVVADRLRVAHPSFLPAERRVALDADGAPAWPPYLVISLEGAPLSITGRVEDQVGEPLASVPVWIGDPTLLGMSASPDGRPARHYVEGVLAGEPDADMRQVRTDARGRFTIDGLADREYTLEAMEESTLLRAVATTHAGDHGVVLVMPSEDGLYSRVSGRIVSRAGHPVAGASVGPMGDVFVTRYRGQVMGTRHARAEATTTDEAGRFTLRDVPRDLAYLRVDGEDMVPIEYGRGFLGGLEAMAGDRIEDLVIEVAMRCHFQVELTDPDSADAFSIVDAENRELPINSFHGTGRMTTHRMPLENGRTGVLAAQDDGAEIVLYSGGAEVARVPISLTPGETTELDL